MDIVHTVHEERQGTLCSTFFVDWQCSGSVVKAKYVEEVDIKNAG